MRSKQPGTQIQTSKHSMILVSLMDKRQYQKGHINNEDICREANIEPMVTFLGLICYDQVLTMEGMDTTTYNAKDAGAGNEKKWEMQENMARQHQG